MATASSRKARISTCRSVFFGIGPGCCGLHGGLLFVGIVERSETPALAGAGPGLVERDPHEPGRQLRPALELIEVLERPDPGILDDVLGFGGVAGEHGPRGAVELLVVAAHEDLEEVDLARAHAVDDLFIRGGAGFGSHCCHGVAKGARVTGLSLRAGSRLYGGE